MGDKVLSGMYANAMQFLLVLITLNLVVMPPALFASSPPENGLVTGSLTAPPVHVCGNAAILTGPSTQPPGSIAVNTSENLETVVSNEPAGTTFWVESGIHYLGAGIYSQVPTKTGDTFIGAPNAIVDGQHYNDYAFTGSATNVTIEYLTIQNFGAPYASAQQGEVNQGQSAGWKVVYSTIRDNDGAGVLDSTYNNVSYDCLTQNGQYGYQGVGHNYTLSHDEISFNDVDNLEATPYSCGCSGGGKSWISQNGIITNDYIFGNFNVGVWVDTDNVGINISNDYVLNNFAEGIMYEASYNGRISRDTLVGNGQERYYGPADFPDPGIYISESGGDKRVSNLFYLFNITNNTFLNNVGGVVLWENSDRHCNNRVDGVCTLPDTSVTTPSSGTIYIISTASNSVVGTIPVGVNPYDVAFSPSGTFAYAVNDGSVPSGSGTVSIISTASNSVVGTINVGTSPLSVAFSPSGSVAYVTNLDDSTVSVINTATNSVVNTISTGANTDPYGVAFSPSGSFAYVTTQTEYDYGTATISVINVATNSVTSTIDIGGADLDVPANPYGVAFNPSGTLAYVADESNGTVSVISTASNSIVNTISLGQYTNPYSVAFNPSGTLAYVADDGSNTVSVINTASNSVINTINAGTGPFGVSFSPSGSFAYVTNSGGGTISVINVASNSVTSTIASGLGAEPDDMAFSPSGSFAYVANTTSCQVIPYNAFANSAQYWSCRWRTMNVTVSNNYFFFNFTNSQCGLYTNFSNSDCGYSAIFSEFGAEGSYGNYRIGSNITYFQNNHFNNNTYAGNWQFDPYEQGVDVNSIIWQGKEIWNPAVGGAQCCQFVNQDVNSLFIP